MTDNDYLFTGEQYDYGLAQYYLRARYYDPVSGRFSQADDFLGFDTMPDSLHLYGYVHDNPISFPDPTGHSFLLGKLVASSIRTTQTIASGVSYRVLVKNAGTKLACISIEEFVTDLIVQHVTGGLYILLEPAGVYVGRSIDVDRRIGQHIKGPMKRVKDILARFHFDGVAEELRVLEQEFIEELGKEYGLANKRDEIAKKPISRNSQRLRTIVKNLSFCK